MPNKYRRNAVYDRHDRYRTPLDRNARARLIFQAELMEVRTKAPGKQSGCLGLTGLAVLRVLLLRFQNPQGGRCDPSYDSIQRITKFCRQTIADAIQRLEQSGFLIVTRRLERIGNLIRQRTNGYGFKFPAKSESLPHSEKPRSYKNHIFMPKIPGKPFASWESWDSPLKSALQKLGQSLGLKIPNDMGDTPNEYMILDNYSMNPSN